jgi:Zn-dependent protease
MPLSLTIIQKIAVWAIPVLFAITMHEAAHAWAAYKCGDSTAKMLGRLSLNPMRHIDLFGTILIPLMVGVLTHFQFVFGWAKPVPINWQNLRKPRLDSALVSLAGPGANIIMALIWAICFKAAIYFNAQTSIYAFFLLLMGKAGILINLILALVNLIPIPPLDGSRVIASLLPNKQKQIYQRLEPFGFIILLILLITGVLGWVLQPILLNSLQALQWLFNL